MPPKDIFSMVFLFQSGHQQEFVILVGLPYHGLFIKILGRQHMSSKSSRCFLRTIKPSCLIFNYFKAEAADRLRFLSGETIFMFDRMP